MSSLANFNGNAEVVCLEWLNRIIKGKPREVADIERCVGERSEEKREVREMRDEKDARDEKDEKDRSHRE